MHGRGLGLDTRICLLALHFFMTYSFVARETETVQVAEWSVWNTLMNSKAHPHLFEA